MKSNDSWNYRVLIVDDQEEIHNDFEEMLAFSLTKRATDELAAAFVAQSDKPVLPQFELSHAASGERSLRNGQSSPRVEPSLCTGLH